MEEELPPEKEDPIEELPSEKHESKGSKRGSILTRSARSIASKRSEQIHICTICTFEIDPL